MKISVSFMKSLLKPKDTIKKINQTDCDFLHVDITDGKFVKNKNFTIGELKKILEVSEKPLDVHLMVNDPKKYIDELVLYDTEYITIHYEAVSNLEELINYIKSLGIKIGIAISPKTSVKKIVEYLPLTDLVLVMSVKPGMGGQEFLMSQVKKLEELIILKEKYNFLISVDGGINNETINLIKDYIDIVSVGSFVTMADDYQEQLNLLQK